MGKQPETLVNGENIARDVVALGASAGGVEALMGFLEPLPRDLPAAVIIVLHRSPHQQSVLASVLGRHSSMPVTEPRNGDRLELSRVYLAPQDFHLVVRGRRFALLRTAKEHFTRPAIDPLFRSLAENWRRPSVAEAEGLSLSLQRPRTDLALTDPQAVRRGGITYKKTGL